MKGIIVAFYGNRGVGVSTFAAAVAVHAARTANKGPYNEILISGDKQIPGYAIWQPDKNSVGNLDSLFSQSAIYAEDVFNSITHPDGAPATLGLLSYPVGRESTDFIIPEEERIRELLLGLKRYDAGETSIGSVIVDCTDRLNDPISSVALQEADLVITLFRADRQGIAFYRSNRSLFRQLEQNETAQLRFVVKRNTFDPAQDVAEAVQTKLPYIPVMDEAHRNMVDGRLFSAYAQSDYRHCVETAAQKMLEVSGYVL